jgi:2,4-dienoyl-CoA reductase-like NADH-dependent reductase (Old Yellow Enzyme family)
MAAVGQARAAAYITPLLKPLQVGSLRLRNRFVMPGMQRAWTVDGAPDERMREYYRRRALGGAALIITEACAVDHPSATSNSLFGWLTARTATAWRSCVDAVHEAGGAMLLQLWHQGAVDTGEADLRPGFVALSPSGLSHPDKAFGRAASAAELDEIKQAFARSAVLARRPAPTAWRYTPATDTYSTSSSGRPSTCEPTATAGRWPAVRRSPPR